jgi:hypothetical protein
MCAACAIAAMAGANGARSWLHAHHESWLTPRRMKVATATIFTAATIGSSVAINGSTPPTHHGAVAATAHQSAERSSQR